MIDLGCLPNKSATLQPKGLAFGMPSINFKQAFRGMTHTYIPGNFGREATITAALVSDAPITFDRLSVAIGIKVSKSTRWCE